MRWVIAVVLLVGARPAFADPRAEMAAALVAQIDAHPRRAAPPTSQSSSVQVVRADRGNSEANASAIGLVHQAAAAAASAAGQAQAVAAKARPHMPHPAAR